MEPTSERMQAQEKLEKKQNIKIKIKKIFEADNEWLQKHIYKLESMDLEDINAVENVCTIYSNLAALITRGVGNFRKIFNMPDMSEDKKKKMNESIMAFERFIFKVGFSAIGIIDAGKFVYNVANTLAPEGTPFLGQIHIAIGLLSMIQKLLYKIFEVLAKLTTKAVNIVSMTDQFRMVPVPSDNTR